MPRCSVPIQRSPVRQSSPRKKRELHKSNWRRLGLKEDPVDGNDVGVGEALESLDLPQQPVPTCCCESEFFEHAQVAVQFKEPHTREKGRPEKEGAGEGNDNGCGACNGIGRDYSQSRLTAASFPPHTTKTA